MGRLTILLGGVSGEQRQTSAYGEADRSADDSNRIPLGSRRVKIHAHNGWIRVTHSMAIFDCLFA